MIKFIRHNYFLLYFAVGAAVGFAGTCFFCIPSLPEIIAPQKKADVFESKFGNWLAAQHAIYSDDFERAMEFLKVLSDVDAGVVADTRDLVLFLETGAVDNPRAVRKHNIGAHRIINAAGLARERKWREVYNSFKNERNILWSPFRIWSGVATERFTQTLEYIDSFDNASESWKNFKKAMVYASTRNPRTARRFFAKVPATFMNLSDYHLRMSFYKRFGFHDDAEALRKQWVSSPGGMYMANLEFEPDWSYYDSFQKMLAASLLQNVAHSGERGFTDSGLLALRVAAALGGHGDSLNYYTGGYFHAVGSSNYRKYWDRLEGNKIFKPFIDMKIAEGLEGISDRQFRRELERILRESPLFMPAIVKSWRRDMQSGREHDALRMLNRALRQPDVPDAGRAYLLKLRAHTFYLFGQLDKADKDLEAAAEVASMDAGVIGLRARVWAAQGRNLEEAYRFAISLIKAFPGNVENWTILALVVQAQEGWEPALEILNRVARVSEEGSELFFHLGNLRMRAGDREGAAEAYRRAIALSGDGLIIRSEAERRLRRIR